MKSSLISASLLLLIWHSASALLGLPFLPFPGQVFLVMARSLRSGELSPHLLISLLRVLAALVLAFVPALFLGMAAGRSRRADSLISPGMYLLFPVPKVALLPVILLFLGLGNGAKIFFVALIVFFPFYLHIRDEAAGLSSRYFDALRSLGGARGDAFRHILLPALLPRIFSSLRMNLGTAIAVLFLAETFATRRGIGWYIMDAWSRLAYDEMFAGIMALSLAGLVLFFLVDRAEARFCRWQRS
jgi:NitT/TauT family transport system permease protein